VLHCLIKTYVSIDLAKKRKESVTYEVEVWFYGSIPWNYCLATLVCVATKLHLLAVVLLLVTWSCRPSHLLEIFR